MLIFLELRLNLRKHIQDKLNENKNVKPSRHKKQKNVLQSNSLAGVLDVLCLDILDQK